MVEKLRGEDDSYCRKCCRSSGTCHNRKYQCKHCANRSKHSPSKYGQSAKPPSTMLNCLIHFLHLHNLLHLLVYYNMFALLLMDFLFLMCYQLSALLLLLAYFLHMGHFLLLYLVEILYLHLLLLHLLLLPFALHISLDILCYLYMFLF